MMNSLRLASFRSIRRSLPISKTASKSITQQPQQRNAHTVRVILTTDLPEGKGYAGEVHSVKAGFARNHLIPLKKALYATPQNFARAGIPDPDLRTESAEERKKRESMESDEDLKAADFLQYYLRNKTLEIWRQVDVNATATAAVSGTGAGAPIHPGMVDHKAVREKLSKQLKIDLEDFETVQIIPEPVSHFLFEEDTSKMEEMLENVKPLEDGESCPAQLRALGEYLVKINLKGDYSVGLKLAVKRR